MTSFFGVGQTQALHKEAKDKVLLDLWTCRVRIPLHTTYIIKVCAIRPQRVPKRDQEKVWLELSTGLSLEHATVANELNCPNKYTKTGSAAVSN